MERPLDGVNSQRAAQLSNVAAQSGGHHILDRLNLVPGSYFPLVISFAMVWSCMFEVPS